MSNTSLPEGKNFFASLYADPQAISDKALGEAATQLVGRIAGSLAVSHETLQSLNAPAIQVGAASEALMQAAFGGIKGRSLDEVLGNIPTDSLETLMAAAQQAGFDIEIAHLSR